MKFIISGKNITVSPGLKTAVEDKLGKLERYFTPDTEVIVTLSVEKERQKIEVTIPMKGNNLESNRCIRKMHAYRWNFWDTISSYSSMQKPSRST